MSHHGYLLIAALLHDCQHASAYQADALELCATLKEFRQTIESKPKPGITDGFAENPGSLERDLDIGVPEAETPRNHERQAECKLERYLSRVACLTLGLSCEQ